ncbi:MAG: hypothetical protein Tsb002_38480 [Wenzhouxiangellaceae bacterium]
MSLSSEDNALFLKQFFDLSLPKSQFDHYGHLRFAWLVLREQPLSQACPTIANAIRRYATHLGAADKYHHTLTLAIIHLMAARMGDETSFDEYLQRHPELVNDMNILLAQHYSPECLHSESARQSFQLPDRQPLPACTASESAAAGAAA